MNVIRAFIRNRRVLCIDVSLTQRLPLKGFADRQREKAQVANQQGRTYRSNTQLRTKS